jgi:TPP-dependent 2-oxoacid decarboxylase
MITPYTVSDYLLDRLSELGVDRVFGVPGDYTLGLLDHVVAHEHVEWTGCANELNAGYAADGYGRMRGIAALCTTFGVGELSAINAITGSFAEFVPVVHVVGAPSSGAQAAQRVVHHSLGDGTFTHFLDMHALITCARAALTAASATDEIDRVLTAVRARRLPGYLLLPADVAGHPVDPPAAPLPAAAPVADPVALGAFTAAADRLLSGTDDRSAVTLLGGVLVHRLGAAGAFAELVAAGPLPHASTLWGKSVVDESDATYVGIYSGAASDPRTRAAIERAEVLVVAGVQVTDLNSGFFSQQLPRERTIELGAETASVGAARFDHVPMAEALRVLTWLVRDRQWSAAEATPVPEPPAPVPPAGDPLTQQTLAGTVGAQLRPGDIVLADQGTSFYGLATERLPHDVTFLGQPLWASIGWTLPALLGACLASPGRRGVLLIGDGAAQMTAQELSTVVRYGLPASVVVVDNAGYTVERAIHGPEQPYNDIDAWDWTLLPALVGGTKATVRTAATVGELAAALAERPDGLTFVQARLPRMDVPPLLTMLAAAAAAANARKETTSA